MKKKNTVSLIPLPSEVGSRLFAVEDRPDEFEISSRLRRLIGRRFRDQASNDSLLKKFREVFRVCLGPMGFDVAAYFEHNEVNGKLLRASVVDRGDESYGLKVDHYDRLVEVNLQKSEHILVNAFSKRDIHWHNFKNGYGGEAAVKTIVLVPFFKGNSDFGVIELRSLNYVPNKEWMVDILIDTAERLASFKHEIDLNFQLQERRELLANASKLVVVNELSSSMVNQMNSPLTIVFGKLKVVTNAIKANRVDLEECKGNLDSVLKHLNQVAQVVKSLKALAQVEKTPAIDSVDMRDVIATTVSLQEERCKKNNIVLSVFVRDPVIIKGSQSQLTQVLMSLLDNAIVALETQAEKWVKINLIEDSANMYLYITDSGQGIPSEVARKIMLPFFTTKGQGQSCGLGLSISHGIVEAHRGELYLNQHHPNTQFVVRLPKLNIEKRSF